VKHLLRRDTEAFRKDLEVIDFPFLVVLLAGIGTAFLLMSGVILSLLANHAVETYSFFLGLIIASAVAIFLEIRSPGAATVAYLAVGAGAGYLLGGLGHFDIGHSLPVIFLTGMTAICAMILPVYRGPT
jgi:putative membrane protein